MARRPVAVRDGACSSHSHGPRQPVSASVPAESSEPGRGAWEMISWADPVSILNGQMGGGRWDDVFASGWGSFHELLRSFLQPGMMPPVL